MSLSPKKSVLLKSVTFWVVFASFSFAEVKRIALFSRLVPPKFDLFPSLICFTSAQDLFANPIPSLWMWNGKQQNQGHWCKAKSKVHATSMNYHSVHLGGENFLDTNYKLQFCSKNVQILSRRNQ